MSGRLLRIVATAIALVVCPDVAAATSPPSKQTWLRRHRPEPGSGELAVHAGILLLNERHSLFHADPGRYLLGYKRLRGPNLTLGFRGGYYPLRHLGIEAEVA